MILINELAWLLNLQKGTSFLNVKAKIEDYSANIAAEAGLVRAINGDDAGLARPVTFLDHNDVVARHSHTGKREGRPIKMAR